MILLIWVRDFFCNSFTSFKSHLANLLRHKANHEYDYGGGKHKGAHVGEAARHTTRHTKGIKVIKQTCQECNKTYGKKYPERGIQSTNFYNDHKKTDAVFEHAYAAFPVSAHLCLC
ncbi:MAG: hypothetical protein JRD93_02930 [Deltaproteobacteria bacterium]|nr:hypothetical protein [Deltaproteobacteria bacterium]MBW2660951.1 hypothetical protein [Deltaproteobacteria bacterium]